MITYRKSRRPNHTIQGNEIIIHASNRNTAQKTLSLILAAIHAYHGDPPVFEVNLLAWNKTEPENRHLREHAQVTTYSTTRISTSCAIAAKASRNLKYVYALSKYYRSISTFSIYSVDMHPGEFIRSSPLPDDHTIYAESIILAYSAIEDLGFDVRASTKNPSKIDGAWNPKILHNLEDRLSKGNIDINEPFLWAIRGSKRKTESINPLPILSKESWASGHVRDSTVRLVDAIAQSSWLRSRVAAHKTRKIIRSLSPYDVYNVQHLSRRLLLETLGFWQTSH